MICGEDYNSLINLFIHLFHLSYMFRYYFDIKQDKEKSK